MQCLVLGGAGFIGSHIVDALVAAGRKVRVFDLPNINLSNLKGSAESLEIVGGDYSNVHDLERALEGIDVVIHLVGSTLPEPSNKNPVYDVEINVVGSIRLLDLAVQQGIRKIIFASSGGTVYGIPKCLPIPETHPTNPLCSYGITKLTIEKYLALYKHIYNLDYTVLRLGNPFGQRQRLDNVQGVIAVFLGKVCLNQPITVWGDGSVSRDFFYISDLVSAFLRVINSDSKSDIYNIASGQPYSLNEILTVIRDVTGKTPEIRYTPGRKLDIPVNCLDISRARDELDWQPHITLREGIARTWEWVKSVAAKDSGPADI